MRIASPADIPHPRRGGAGSSSRLPLGATPGEPPMPDWLGAHGRRAWRLLVPRVIDRGLCRCDGEPLGRLAWMLSIWAAERAVLAGLAGDPGRAARNRRALAVEILSQLRPMLERLEGEFFLTACDRREVVAALGQVYETEMSNG